MNKQIIALLIACALPMISLCESAEAAHTSKLKLTGDNSVEGRFRQPGEPYKTNVKRKTSNRILVAQAETRPETRQKRNRDVVADNARSEIQSSPVGVSSSDFEAANGSSLSQLRSSTRLLRPRTYSKNNISLELLGRGAVYSINYDRLLGKSLALGLGFSYMSMDARMGDVGNMKISVTLIPLYTNFYMNDSMVHRFLGTAGVTVANVSVSAGSDLPNQASKASETPLPFDLDTQASASVTIPLPIAGIGYEYRSQGGFLARLTGYGVFYGTFQPWAGVGLGGHF